jgi:hypothetical protein
MFGKKRIKGLEVELEICKKAVVDLSRKLDKCNTLLGSMVENYDIPYCVRKKVRELIKEIEV